ncbi:hypothetical protein [Sutterella wadsworthensis]|nr:hypothetical protein [Sutterella sp.]
MQYKSIPLQDVELKMMERSTRKLRDYVFVFNDKDIYGDVMLPYA